MREYLDFGRVFGFLLEKNLEFMTSFFFLLEIVFGCLQAVAKV
jgi:hypothetical protein